MGDQGRNLFRYRQPSPSLGPPDDDELISREGTKRYCFSLLVGKLDLIGAIRVAVYDSASGS